MDLPKESRDRANILPGDKLAIASWDKGGLLYLFDQGRISCGGCEGFSWSDDERDRDHLISEANLENRDDAISQYRRVLMDEARGYPSVQQNDHSKGTSC
jgi:hypothetical protein